MKNQKKRSSPSSSSAPTPLESELEVFADRLHRIAALERRVNARAVALRRRWYSMRSSFSACRPGRQTHLRIFLSHSYVPEVTPAAAVAALMKQAPVVSSTTPSSSGYMTPPRPSPPVWMLHIEGKLLVDHLDRHEAKAFDAKTNYHRQFDRSKSEEKEG